MTTPTVGRIVHYYNEGETAESSLPQAAIICRVWSDTCVNLSIFNPNGNSYQATSVLLVQDEAPPANQIYCVWPPRV